jgi:hypothetical protein
MSKKSKVIARRTGLKSGNEKSITGQGVTSENEDVSSHPSKTTDEQGHEAGEKRTIENVSKATYPLSDHNPTPHSRPKIPGFDLGGASQYQQNITRFAVILCDCCVQRGPDGVFDVLGRNFPDTGSLAWWLRRLGKGHLADLVKRKDIVDAIRKVSHDLFQELRAEIGRPIARW